MKICEINIIFREQKLNNDHFWQKVGEKLGLSPKKALPLHQFLEVIVFIGKTNRRETSYIFSLF